MALDNVIFPEPFRLATRNPQSVSNFQLALFESAKRACRGLNPVFIPSGEKVFRNVKDRFSKWEARQVPPEASKTPNRWSGLIAGTNLGRRALYTSQDPKGFLDEALRYSRRKETKEIPWVGSNTGRAKYTIFGPASDDLPAAAGWARLLFFYVRERDKRRGPHTTDCLQILHAN